MPSDHPFVSFGANAEDVVLHRALAEVTDGRYVEVGAHHPTGPSVTRAFYDRGWSGITVQPVPDLVEEFRRLRPRDGVVVATEERAARGLDAVLDEHLRPGDDIHFMVIGTAESAGAVLAGVDLRRWRPWVLVVASGAPGLARPDLEWEHLVGEAGYEFCLFDGVSRFYVAAECADRLRPALTFPANVHDDFVPHRWHALDQELVDARRELAELRHAHDEALEELVRWRGAVLARWSDVLGTSAGSGSGGSHEVVRLKEELAAMRATVSWRVTAPLRALQQRRLHEW